MVNNYSVGQYANNIYKNRNKVMVVQYNSKVIEEMFSQELSASVDAVSTMMPQEIFFIALIITCAYDLHDTKVIYI